MVDIGNQCSTTERRAESAYFDVLKRLKARFMSDKVGHVFTGTITGVRDFGIFVMLDEHPVDGLVHVSELGADFFVYDRTRMELEGRRNGRRFRLGDKVSVVVSEVDLDMGKIDFLLAESRDEKKRRKPKRRK